MEPQTSRWAGPAVVLNRVWNELPGLFSLITVLLACQAHPGLCLRSPCGTHMDGLPRLVSASPVLLSRPVLVPAPQGPPAPTLPRALGKSVQQDEPELQHWAPSPP